MQEHHEVRRFGASAVLVAAASARRLAPLAALIFVGCGAPQGPPPPPLPPPPAPIIAPLRAGVDEEAAPWAEEPTAQDPEPRAAEQTPRATPQRPAAEGRDLSALRIALLGCRALGLRLDPTMSGRALLRAEVGAHGQVLAVQVMRAEGLPRAVLSCVAERVQNTHFDTRGRPGVVLSIPIDFTRRAEPATPTVPGVRSL